MRAREWMPLLASSTLLSTALVMALATEQTKSE